MKKKRNRYILCSALILIIILVIWVAIETTSSQENKNQDYGKPFPGYNVANGKLRDLSGNMINTFGFSPFDFKSDLIAGNSGGTASIRYWNGSFFLKTNYSAHHDIAFTKKETLLFLSADRHIYKDRDVTFDTIIELSFDGELISKWSSFDNKDQLTLLHETSPLEDSMQEGEDCSVWSELKQRRGCYEYYHFNSINELPQTELGKLDQRFQAGNWIVSDRKYDLVFIIDKDTKEVVWSLDRKHNVRKQHDAKMLPSGNILIFDNGEFEEDVSRNYSRVVEYNPQKDEIVWEYGNQGEEPLYSISMGGAQRLPNGNTLITESLLGRAFEVTPEKEKVWEWINPESDHHRLENNVMYRLIRLSTDYVEQQGSNIKAS